MNKLRLIILRLIEVIFLLIGKDPMKYKLERYRLRGATIGSNVRAFSPISSAEPYLITIGDNVTIATGVKFITHDNSAIKIYNDATDFVGPIIIGDNVFVGANSTILLGVTIADNCIVGAGSLVCRSCLEPGTIIAGNPAKSIGKIDQMREKYALNKFDFRNSNRQAEIMNNKNKWIKK